MSQDASPGGSWSPPLGITPLSHIQLDDLLQELLDRVGEVMESRERLSALLQAVVAVGSDLDLHSTLERIVKSACVLVGAKYGALGVIGQDRNLTEFITDGLTAAEHQAIGALPTGRGILGLLIDEPHPVRLANIAEHPRSFGFPAQHPVMRSFLGVPIRIRDQVFGNLYLTEKKGADEFSADDEEVVVALATAAGVAIENARLYRAAGRRQRWLEATAEITYALTGRVDGVAALRLVAERARQVAEAELALVALGEPLHGALRVEVTAPAAAGLEQWSVNVAGTPFEAVMTTRDHVVVDDLSTALLWPDPVPAGPALLAPLKSTDGVQGVLVVAMGAGSPGFRDIAEVNMITTFAAQAALALERAQAEAEREQLVVLEDRERIARDLHDVVIQRLFATGLRLQAILRLVTRDEAYERLNEAIDSLDVTIRDIRSAIFELRTPAGESLRLEAGEILEGCVQSLGFQPEFTVSGPIDTAVPDDLRTPILAVLNEALSNVARHARASRTGVEMTVGEGRFTLVVTDDGVGLNVASGDGHGLKNMRARAQDLGGDCTVTTATPHGAKLVWWAPLST